MTSAHCPKCGTEIAHTANFCVGCGASFNLDDDEVPDPYVGRKIADNYLIEDRIGLGSMGVVYVAEQLSLKKKVAIKILKKSLVNNSEVLARFEREARAASRLDHPNSISILDFGQNSDGAPFIAMEFLDGRDLGQILADEFPLDPVRVVQFMMMVCAALDEAHAEGIVHRDIKPANIMVCKRRSGEEYVKVLDFGIAKLNDPEMGGSSLTREGLVCGTPAFMSPEQVQGEAIDSRSDIYSLGVILFTLVTGRLPFQAASSAAMAAKILTEVAPKPSKVRLDVEVDQVFDTLVERALARDKADRYATALDFRRALETALTQLQDDPASPAPAPPPSTEATAAAKTSPGPAPPPPSSRPTRPAWPDLDGIAHGPRTPHGLGVSVPRSGTPSSNRRPVKEDAVTRIGMDASAFRDASVPTVFDGAPVTKDSDDLKVKRGAGAYLAVFAMVIVAVGLSLGGWRLWQMDQHPDEPVPEEGEPAETQPVPREAIGIAAYEGRLALVRAIAAVADNSRSETKSRVPPKAKGTRREKVKIDRPKPDAGAKPAAVVRGPSGKAPRETDEPASSPKALEPGARANEEYRAGQGLMGTNASGALAHFEKAVKYNPRHRNAWLGIHRMSVRLGRDKRARVGCLRVVALSRAGDIHRKSCEKWLQRN